MTKALFVPHTRIGVCPARSWFGGFCALTLLALLCLVPTRAFCQAPAPAQVPAAASPVSDLLDVLLANGTITQQQYDALKQRFAARHEAQMAEQAAQPAQPVQMVMPANVVTAMDNAVGFHVGRFDLTFSGDINGFYVHDRPDRSAGSSAGCVLCLASNSAVANSSIRNGLLPGDLTIKVATKEKGYDVAFTFGIWPGISNLMTSGAGGLNLNAGNPSGFGTAGIDFRQQYLTVGRRGLGTFKFGRDLGFFGQEALLNDMTLLGVGTTNGNTGPGSVSLGRIGVGYIYTDWIPQISYTSPSAHGLHAAVGVFTPMSDVVPTTLGLPQYSAPLTGHGQPQFQAKLAYAAPKIGGAKTNFWANYITQSMEANDSDHSNDYISECRTVYVHGAPVQSCRSRFQGLNIAPGDSVRANGVDYGMNLSLGGASFVAYGYNGWGIGTEGLFFLATSPTGETRPSQGYYLQGTYTVAKKWTFGASYGQSNLSLAGNPGYWYGDLPGGETMENSTHIIRSNSSYVGQARYALTSNVTLLGEYTHMRSESQGGLRGRWAVSRDIGTSDSFALGSIAFF
jgi:predicted porin